MPNNSIWIGFDTREAPAFVVALSSIRRHLSEDIHVRGIVLADVKARGLYWRPMEYKPSELERPVLWDVISDAPCSTEFAVSRFLTLHLARELYVPEEPGWAMFLDCDMLVRADLAQLFAHAETQSDKAVLCVKHKHVAHYTTKMDGQIQTNYGRKNWSSVMLFHCGHPSNEKLTLDLVNSVPGRDLHRFCWLADDEIGELGPEWNFLVGHTDPEKVPDPKIVHHTEGSPFMRGYESAPFSDEWRAELNAFGTLARF